MLKVASTLIFTIDLLGLDKTQGGLKEGKLNCLERFCKVEFIQSFCGLYSVPNLLVIQHLETLYLGGNRVRVVCERV